VATLNGRPLKLKASDGQNSIHSRHNRWSICNNLVYRFHISEYFWKHYDNLITYYNCRYGCFLFFIQQHITKRKEGPNKRHNHFAMMADILQKWVDIRANLSVDIEGRNHSSTELYVDTFDKLKYNLRFQRVKSHLQNEDYKEAKDVLDKIETRSTIHNTNVSDFMLDVNGLIIKNVFRKDQSLLIIFNFTEYTLEGNQRACIIFIIITLKKHMVIMHS